MTQGLADPMSDLLHLCRAHATRGQGRCADANTTWIHRLARVEGNHIHVDSDAALVERLFCRFTTEPDTGYVDQHQVIVRATTNQTQTVLHQRFGQDLGVVDHALTVSTEVISERLTKANSFTVPRASAVRLASQGIPRY